MTQTRATKDPLSAPTLARNACTVCGADFATPEQIARWPHLARYGVGWSGVHLDCMPLVDDEPTGDLRQEPK